ncbi:PREDICTED: putative pumilio homolog 13 [Camelina sativa]|uniref:Pumilio homolog 13 n=1 Tax=Camelina sativa TaxID=90675 RepID=A0ABM1RF89_CAMSA|nr:PREDICTED: putative pumilio homolog 13 [Camelina sativa]
MDKKFRVNTNGERDIWSTAEETPETATFRRGGTQSQPPQMQQQPSSQFHQPESSHQRVSNGFLSDLQTLESSFGGLSFSDSTVRQNGQPMPPNRYNQVINGGGSGVVGGGNGYMPPLSVGYYQREFEEIPRFNRMQQRLSVQNDCSNRSSYDTYGLLNNGFLNGVSYSSRNHVSDQNPWDHSNGFGTGMNNLWMGFGYNHDQALAMANWREPPSILSMAKDKDLRDHLLMTLLGPQERVDVIFNALIAHLFDLMVDSHANDVVRRLMDKCSPEQLIQILDMVTQSQSQFVNLCFDPLGTKAMQSLVINIRLRCGEDQILRFLGAITMVALRLSRSSNAKEVILECFCQFTFLQCRHLVEVVAGHCYQIAIDQHGCCLIQQCFNNKRPMPFQIRQRFISEIITHALKLCLNCYGNYVVQYVVELENQQVTEALVVQLLGSYAYLARNKYGSHAVQKLLQLKSINTRLIVNDLVQEIDTLLVDPFGNYVIQTAWFVSKDDVRHMLKWHIERNIRLMRCNKFGNKILERLNL